MAVRAFLTRDFMAVGSSIEPCIFSASWRGCNLGQELLILDLHWGGALPCTVSKDDLMTSLLTNCRDSYIWSYVIQGKRPSFLCKTLHVGRGMKFFALLSL